MTKAFLVGGLLLVCQSLYSAGDGEMPPPGMPQPVHVLPTAVPSAVPRAVPRAVPGVVPGVVARRLNRTEYNNTVRDLLGVDIDAAAEFPPDDSASGFDNMAESLTLSPLLMEKYLAAAEKISRAAVFGPGQIAGSKPKLVCDRHPGCERTMLGNLAARAFRRPATKEEVDELLSIVSSAQERGRSAKQGTALAIEAMLVSPDFLFRIEKNDAESSQYELASRLSYFLWSTMPDEELMRCARLGTLQQGGVLEHQVRRMLAHPRAQALAANFAGQWLEIRRLESIQPDRARFPDWDDSLKSAMLRETQLFFENVVKEDRPILDFIDAPWTFLNERLARHYNIPGIIGPEFRKVDLRGTGRAGLLTQASVLTVSSYGNRTSPVLRGKWILENLLNTPPPPPPPNVRSLDEAATGNTASLRQQMEQHRRRPACASCHARMDQLGFALENYDAIGQWRTKDGNFPIDASGLLPDGQAFQGADGLEAVLKKNAAGFTQGITAKLLSYALGRAIEPADGPAIQKISASLAANHYRFSSLIVGIVNSAPFQGSQP